MVFLQLKVCDTIIEFPESEIKIFEFDGIVLLQDCCALQTKVSAKHMQKIKNNIDNFFFIKLKPLFVN